MIRLRAWKCAVWVASGHRFHHRVNVTVNEKTRVVAWLQTRGMISDSGERRRLHWKFIPPWQNCPIQAGLQDKGQNKNVNNWPSKWQLQSQITFLFCPLSCSPACIGQFCHGGINFQCSRLLSPESEIMPRVCNHATTLVFSFTVTLTLWWNLWPEATHNAHFQARNLITNYCLIWLIWSKSDISALFFSRFCHF